MALTFKFFHDSALTQEIDGGAPLTATQDSDGGIGPIDKIVYLGSPASGTQIQASSDPGVDPIVVSIEDADPGTGAPASEFRLALSSGGLASATPGAPLVLSHTLFSGTGNAVPIHTRRTSALTVPGVYTDLSLRTNSVTEGPV